MFDFLKCQGHIIQNSVLNLKSGNKFGFAEFPNGCGIRPGKITFIFIPALPDLIIRATGSSHVAVRQFLASAQLVGSATHELHFHSSLRHLPMEAPGGLETRVLLFYPQAREEMAKKRKKKKKEVMSERKCLYSFRSILASWQREGVHCQLPAMSQG